MECVPRVGCQRKMRQGGAWVCPVNQQLGGWDLGRAGHWRWGLAVVGGTQEGQHGWPWKSKVVVGQIGLRESGFVYLLLPFNGREGGAESRASLSRVPWGRRAWPRVTWHLWDLMWVLSQVGWCFAWEVRGWVWGLGEQGRLEVVPGRVGGNSRGLSQPLPWRVLLSWGHELLPWQHAASFQKFPELSTA